jgi:NADH:ubiquinone oxidoreductase subunit 4 (subunit M)
MLLAGILLKMGGYAIIRMNVGMLPDAHGVFAPDVGYLRHVSTSSMRP